MVGRNIWLGLTVLTIVLATAVVAVNETVGPSSAVATTAPCENGTAVPNPADNPGLVGDCTILLEAKDTLRGTAALDWSADTAIGDWTGITLGGTPERVTRVSVTYDNLDGTIPAGLGGLEELQWLKLGDNALTGAIPAELGALSNLRVLGLSGNDLTGPLPPELATLERLTTLTLGDNGLTGEIPQALFRLTHLDYVELTGNQLTGPIPPIPDDRFDMQGILLDDNQLSGPIPVGLGDLGLRVLQLSGNQLTGCIPDGLRDATTHDLDDLGLSDCTTTTTYQLTTSASANGSISPPPGRYLYLEGESVTVTVTPERWFEVAFWTGDCASAITALTCTLTLDADRLADVAFKPQVYRLRVTKTGEGSVTPSERSFIHGGREGTVTASWDDATHDLTWGGACAGTTGTSTCTLLMDADKDVTATFTELPATRCATPTDADCTLAVYLGAPGDYAQAVDVPADVLLTPAADGRYVVDRWRQVTVATAAPLPAGWTRFYPQQSPLEFGTPAPVSFLQLIQPVGTTYTFTPTEDEDGATLITFDLTAARPHPVRPTHKPELGDIIVTTQFEVVTCESGVAVPDPATNTELVEDCKSLLGLSDTLAGTGPLNWTAGRAMTDWTGVTIEGTPQRVTKLELATSDLTGELAPELGNLSALTELHLNDNALSGSIPAVLGDLENLTNLYLNSNELTGVIPSSLEQLTALTHAFLGGGNDLRGCIPRSLSAARHNDASTLSLPVCVDESDLIDVDDNNAGPGTYRAGGVIFTVPSGLNYPFEVALSSGQMYVVSFLGRVNGDRVPIASVAVGFDGKFHSIQWNGKLYPVIDSDRTAIFKDEDGNVVEIDLPKADGGPTLEQLRYIARSARMAPPEPDPWTKNYSSGQETYVGTAPDGMTEGQVTAQQTTARTPLPTTVRHDQTRVRNLIVGNSIGVCSDYPNVTRDAMNLWNVAIGVQNPDEFAATIFVPQGGGLLPAANAVCEALGIRVASLRPITVHKSTLSDMALHSCGDWEDIFTFRPIAACSNAFHRQRGPYWSPSTGWALVYHRSSYTDVSAPRGRLLHLITHEIGHILGHWPHRPCNATYPDTTFMTTKIGAGSSTCDVTIVAGDFAIPAADIISMNAIYDLPWPRLIQNGGVTTPLLQVGPGPGEVIISFDASHIRTENYILIESSTDIGDWTSPTRVGTVYPIVSDEPFSMTYGGQKEGVTLFYRVRPVSEAHLTSNVYLLASIELPVIPICPTGGSAARNEASGGQSCPAPDPPAPPDPPTYPFATVVSAPYHEYTAMCTHGGDTTTNGWYVNSGDALEAANGWIARVCSLFSSTKVAQTPVTSYWRWTVTCFPNTELTGSGTAATEAAAEQAQLDWMRAQGEGVCEFRLCDTFSCDETRIEVVIGGTWYWNATCRVVKPGQNGNGAGPGGSSGGQAIANMNTWGETACQPAGGTPSTRSELKWTWAVQCSATSAVHSPSLIYNDRAQALRAANIWKDNNCN